MNGEYPSKPPIRLGEGIAGIVASENRPIQVRDVKSDPRYASKSVAEKEDLCSLLCVPMCVKGKVIGAQLLQLEAARVYLRGRKASFRGGQPGGGGHREHGDPGEDAHHPLLQPSHCPRENAFVGRKIQTDGCELRAFRERCMMES